MNHLWQVVNPGKCGGCEVCADLEQHYECTECGAITYDPGNIEPAVAS